MTLEVTNAASIEDFAKDRVQTAGDRGETARERKMMGNVANTCETMSVLRAAEKPFTRSGFLALGTQYLIVVRDGVDPSTSGFSDRRSTD